MRASELQKRYIVDELLRIRSIRHPGWRDHHLEALAQYVKDHPSKANKELMCFFSKALAFDSNGFIRSRVCFIVGDFGTSKDWPLLRKLMLDDPDWLVRSDAVDTFGEVATDRELLYLWKVINVEEHWLVRADAALYLAWRFGDSILDRLRDLLSKEKTFERRHGFLRAILYIRPEEAIEEFMKGLGDDDIGIQSRTLCGLKEERESSDRMLAFADAVFDGAQQALPDMWPHVRREIVDVLAAYGIDPIACLGELVEEPLKPDPSEAGSSG